VTGDHKPLADLRVQVTGSTNDVEHSATFSLADQEGVDTGRAETLVVGTSHSVARLQPAVLDVIGVVDVAVRRAALLVPRRGALVGDSGGSMSVSDDRPAAARCLALRHADSSGNPDPLACR